MSRHHRHYPDVFDVGVFVVALVVAIALLVFIHECRVYLVDKPAVPVARVDIDAEHKLVTEASPPPVLSEPEATPSVSSDRTSPTFEETDISIVLAPATLPPSAFIRKVSRKHYKPHRKKHRGHHYVRHVAMPPAVQASQCEFLPNTMSEQSWIKTYTPPSSLKACQTSSTR